MPKERNNNALDRVTCVLDKRTIVSTYLFAKLSCLRQYTEFFGEPTHLKRKLRHSFQLVSKPRTQAGALIALAIQHIS